MATASEIAEREVMLVDDVESTFDICTVDGWQAWAAAPPPKKPARPTLQEWRSFTEEERWRFDIERIAWHADFGLIKTPDVKEAHRFMRTQVLANMFMPPGRPRPAALIDGLPTLGKSTILQYFGKQVETELRASRDRRGIRVARSERWVPVVYLTLLGDTTLKGFNQQLLRFYNHPAPARYTKDLLTERVVELAHDCGEEVNKHIKALASMIGATFVFAGIDCINGGFLDEGRSPAGRRKSQVRWRVTPHTVRLFEVKKKEQQTQWGSLLGTIENRLVLMKAPERMLSGDLALYLHDRTQGSIGVLCQWIRDAAVTAIQTDTECLTEPLLEATPLPDIE
jgi:hypothetical protein